MNTYQTCPEFLVLVLRAIRPFAGVVALWICAFPRLPRAGTVGNTARWDGGSGGRNLVSVCASGAAPCFRGKFPSGVAAFAVRDDLGHAARPRFSTLERLRAAHQIGGCGYSYSGFHDSVPALKNGLRPA